MSSITINVFKKLKLQNYQNIMLLSVFIRKCGLQSYLNIMYIDKYDAFAHFIFLLVIFLSICLSKVRKIMTT